MDGSDNKHNISKQYSISLFVVGCIVILGFVMQFILGNIDYSLFRAPVSIFFCSITVLTIVIHVIFRRSPFVRLLTGVPFSVVLISAILFFCLLMGLIPQKPTMEAGLWIVRAGFTSITSSWPFVLLYLTLLVCLGSVLAIRLIRFRLQDYAFCLNHAGLWLLLTGAGFGAMDYLEADIIVNEGETTKQGYNSAGHLLALPFSVYLEDFDIEYYPPKLAIVDITSDKYIPFGRPTFVAAVDNGKNFKGQISDWNIEVLEYYSLAILNVDDIPQPVNMPGGADAVLVSVMHIALDKKNEGWLYRGNAFQEPLWLELDDHHKLVMAAAEVKRYVSDVTITKSESEVAFASIEVNKPLRNGSWTIYQTGYDTSAGRMSRHAILQAVYDPWLPVVYIGIAMLATGCICLILTGTRSRRKEAPDGLE